MFHGNLDALWVRKHFMELYHHRVSYFDIWKELRSWFVSVSLFTQSDYGLSSPHSVCYKIYVNSSLMILLFIKLFIKDIKVSFIIREGVKNKK